MKGNLRNPKPISGLDASIRENKSLYFYMDVVNNRNLKAEEFFDYLTKKYSPNGDLFRKIDSLSRLLTPIRADKVNIVIQYKRAELRNKFELIKKLQNDFDKITDAQIDETIDVRKPNKTSKLHNFKNSIRSYTCFCVSIMSPLLSIIILA